MYIISLPPSHSSSVISGMVGRRGDTEETLGVRQGVLRSLRPTWHQPLGPEHVEVGVQRHAGAKGSQKPPRTEVGTQGVEDTQQRRKMGSQEGKGGSTGPGVGRTPATCCVAWGKCLNLSGLQPPGLHTRTRLGP